MNNQNKSLVKKYERKAKVVGGLFILLILLSLLGMESSSVYSHAFSLLTIILALMLGCFTVTYACFFKSYVKRHKI